MSDTVAENEVESLGDTQVELNTKALDYQVGKLGDIAQHRK